jgi:hypothetical protein
MRVILDDDEVSSDEDEPLQKRLRQFSSTRPVVLDEAAAVDKEATDKRAVEEATAKRANEERATVKTATAEEVAAKLRMRPQELPGARRPLTRRPWRSGPIGLQLQVAPPCLPNVPTGVFGNLSLSSFLSPFSPFFVGLHSLITLFAQVLSL